MSTVATPPATDPGSGTTTAVVQEPPAPLPHAWLGFTAVLAATVLNILDSTIINIAGPSIRASLSMGTSSLEWIAAAYTLALAVGLMTGARLGDMYGRRRLFTLGLTGFVVASVLCSMAWSGPSLVGFRIAQGLVGAMMLPQCFGLMRDLFPGVHMAKPFGAIGPAIGMATILGPVVAGVLIRADLFGTGWRSLFWINVPLGLYALAVARRTLPVSSVRRDLRLDVGGMLLLGLGSFLLIFPLVEGRALGWPAWVFGALVSAVPVLGLFVAHQRGRLRAGRHPLLEVSVLRKRSYVSGIGFLLAFFGAMTGFMLVMGLFLQLGMGFSATRASLYLAGLAAGSFVGAGVGAWAATNLGRPILHVGLGVMGVAVAMLLVVLHGATADGRLGAGQLLPGLTVFGLGMGMIFVPLFSIVMGDIDETEVGSASGLLTSMEQLGASLGVAVLATIFFSAFRLEDGGPVAAVRAGRDLLAAQDTLVGVLVMIAVAWLLGWLLPRRARPQTH